MGFLDVCIIISVSAANATAAICGRALSWSKNHCFLSKSGLFFLMAPRTLPSVCKRAQKKNLELTAVLIKLWVEKQFL
jgi:hypothetical protein